MPISLAPLPTLSHVLTETVAFLQGDGFNDYDTLSINQVPGGTAVEYVPGVGPGVLGNGWWGYAPDYSVTIAASDTVTVDAHVTMRIQNGDPYDHAAPARVLFNSHLLGPGSTDFGLVGGQWIPDSRLAIGSAAYSSVIIGFIDVPDLSTEFQEFVIQWSVRPNPATTGPADAGLYRIRCWNLNTGSFNSAEFTSDAYTGAGNRFVLNPHSMDWPVEGNAVRRIRCTLGEVPDLVSLQLAAPLPARAAIQTAQASCAQPAVEDCATAASDPCGQTLGSTSTACGSAVQEEILQGSACGVDASGNVVVGPCGEPLSTAHAPLNPCGYTSSFAVSTQRSIDYARRMQHSLGFRPYKVFLVWQKRNRRQEYVEYRRQELMPVQVSSLNEVDLQLQAVGLDKIGGIYLTEVSPSQVNEASLKGYVNNKPLGDDEQFFYEIIRQPRCATDRPERARFTLGALPFLNATAYQWEISLLYQQPSRSDSGGDRTLDTSRTRDKLSLLKT